MQFALAITRAVRAATGDAFIIIFRLSMLDLIEEGSTLEETLLLAGELEQCGVTLFNTCQPIPVLNSVTPHCSAPA